MALPDRWFRSTPDSSVLPRSRLLARLLIDVADLDECIAFYEWLLGVPADLRMPIPDFGGLELAAVGNVLLIASERSFTAIQRATAYSLIVPSLATELATLHRAGGTVLEPVEAILPGTRARVRYPDGAIAELVEHRPRPGESPAPPAGVAGADTGVRLFARRVVPLAGLDATLRLYETALGTPTAARRPVTAPPDCELARVGNLLVVGSDRLAREPAPRIGCALVVPSARDHLVRAALGADCPTGECRSVVDLAGGVTAEVWNCELG
jgi:catechol 2,3-dioxygenase-like lactoylglutathione lyase family enzyme